MTERQRKTFDLINEFMENNPNATLTQAARATGTVPETYRAAVNNIIKKRKERKIIRRKGNNGNEQTTTA